MNKTQDNLSASQSSIIYSVPISNPEHATGETVIYRHPEAVSRLRNTIKRIPHITTLQQLHQYNTETYGDLNCLGTRIRKQDGSLGEYQFKTFRQTHEIAKKAGSAILNLNLAPLTKAEGNPDCKFIAIYSANCEEWLTLDIGCCLYGFTVLPIFATLGAESLGYIFEHTNAATIFTSSANLERLINEASTGKLFKLKNIICFTGYSEAQKKIAQDSGLLLLSWEEFIKSGEEIQPLPVVTSETIFSVAYTSGTTGNPKGVILTHGNFIAAYAGSEDRNGYDINAIGKGDVHLSYLPLAHIFERFFSHMILCRGVTIGFFGGDVRAINDDLQTLKPTFMISVPRMYNRFYDSIQALLAKENQGAQSEVDSEETISPELLQKMKNLTGGRVKAYYSGSAPIGPEVAKFLKKAFGAPLMEAFGQTEIAGGCLSQRADDESFGHVGGPFTSIEFKLVDVPEMNYTSKDKGPNGEFMPRGELCLRGGQIFKGYYKEPEKTAETIDEQGWHHTGDVATILPNGALKLIDRKKNIFKLAQGEYIAPEKIENVYMTNKYVAEVFVYGDSFRSNTVAIIVPDRENIETLARELDLGSKTYEDLCKDETIIDYVQQDISRTARTAKLAGYEIASRLHLNPKSFVLSGLMTTTMKLKRNIAKESFGEVISALYEPKNPITYSLQAVKAKSD